LVRGHAEPESPNPFNPRTEISFSLPNEGNVRLAIYNVKGELVKTLAQGTYGPGVHTFGWDAANHASEIYFYGLEAPGFGPGPFQQPAGGELGETD